MDDRRFRELVEKSRSGVKEKKRRSGGETIGVRVITRLVDK